MENPTNYTAVEMSAPFLSKYSATSTTLLPPDVMTYGALLSPGTGKTVWYYITVTDSKGNKKATDSPSPIFIPSLTRRVAPLPVKLGTHITNVDINNRTADISWSFEDHNSYNPLNPFDLAAGPDLHIYIDRLENNTVTSPYYASILKTYMNMNNHLDQISSFTAKSKSFPLTGDPSSFPFDHYFLNLRFLIPIKYQTIQYSNEYNKSISSTLAPLMIKQVIDCKLYVYVNNRIMNVNNHIMKAYNESVSMPICTQQNPYHESVWVLHFDFKRNYTVDAITIPILAIFYLLGAIFILESTTDQLTIRLAITLGIFAFLFTLTPIIKDMEPPATVTKVPTVADSLVTVILVATIAFSVSSVISGSPVIRNKFPRGSIWIDRIVFFFVSVVIIWYFRRYSIDITIWIVPVIVFGLGYGLLLRTSGLKIAETLEKIFKKGVKRQQT